jgi:hypothetical protein
MPYETTSAASTRLVKEKVIKPTHNSEQSVRRFRVGFI